MAQNIHRLRYEFEGLTVQLTADHRNRVRVECAGSNATEPVIENLMQMTALFVGTLGAGDKPVTVHGYKAKPGKAAIFTLHVNQGGEDCSLPPEKLLEKARITLDIVNKQTSQGHDLVNSFYVVKMMGLFNAEDSLKDNGAHPGGDDLQPDAIVEADEISIQKPYNAQQIERAVFTLLHNYPDAGQLTRRIMDMLDYADISTLPHERDVRGTKQDFFYRAVRQLVASGVTFPKEEYERDTDLLAESICSTIYRQLFPQEYRARA